MAFENPVKHGDFGDVADKSPERKNDYDRNVKKGDTKTVTNEAHNWGADPEHTRTAKPIKGGDTFSKK
jgi:hypothetical protein